MLFSGVQTKVNPSHEAASVAGDASAYATALVSVDEAMKLFGFKRTTFYRFRHKNQVPVVLGRRIHVGDIISACDVERGKRSANGPPIRATMAEAKGYAAMLITLTAAGRLFGLSTTSFWRLRVRHRVPLVAGGRVHAEDIIGALDAERNCLPVKINRQDNNLTGSEGTGSK